MAQEHVPRHFLPYAAQLSTNKETTPKWRMGVLVTLHGVLTAAPQEHEVPLAIRDSFCCERQLAMAHTLCCDARAAHTCLLSLEPI